MCRQIIESGRAMADDVCRNAIYSKVKAVLDGFRARMLSGEIMLKGTLQSSLQDVTLPAELAATVTDPQHVKSGRQFAAWLGLTPLARRSGGKERLGRISRMGGAYTLLNRGESIDDAGGASKG